MSPSGLIPSLCLAAAGGVRLIKGDLAIGDKCIAEASDDELDRCRSAVLERHVAAYWLQGDNETYSEVPADTVFVRFE